MLALSGDGALGFFPSQSLQMSSFDVAELVRRAEHLLRVIAMCDVENLREQRNRVLRQLRMIELRFRDAGLTDTIYNEVMKEANSAN